ncbi:CHAT domain-containing protein [Lyngbya aestuarii]|uniref:CHAT domain-containing protein n=1 Tax=Lyngbya aestuarii TaxID=118322 RepID=UPI00403DA7BE
MLSYSRFLGVAASTALICLSLPRPLGGTTVDVFSNLAKPKLSKNSSHRLDKDDLKVAHTSLETTLESNSDSRNITSNNPDNFPGNLTSLKYLVGICGAREDLDKSVDYLSAKQAVAEGAEESETRLQVLIALGDTYNCTGEYQQAVNSAEVSLTLAKELQDSQAQVTASIILASAYQGLASSNSEYQKAVKIARSGLTTAWRINNQYLEANALAVLGSIYSSLKENKEAIAFAKRALKIAEVNDLPAVAASSQLTLGSTYLELGDYQSAIESAKASINYLNKLQQREAEGAAWVMLSLAYLKQGNSQAARESASHSLAISQTVNSPLIESLGLIVLGLADSELEELQAAIELVNRSRMITKEQQKNDLEVVALEALGGIYRKYQQREKAVAAYQEAVAIAPDNFSVKAGLASVYTDLNFLSSAITYYKQAINQNEVQTQPSISGLPVWLKHSFPKAVQDISGVPTGEIYRSLANLLLIEKRPVEAQQVLELLKAQEFKEYTGNTVTQSQPVQLPVTPTEEQILQEYGSLISFGARLEECQENSCSELEQLLEKRQFLNQQYYQSLEQLEAEISNKRASDQALIDPNQLNLKAQAILADQPNTVLIYPLILADELWLLWASKGGIVKGVKVPGVNQAQLEVTALKFRQLLQNRLSDVEELEAIGKQLYDWLVEPLESELKASGTRNLIFSLDRSARYIPLNTLFDGEHYLIENYTISTILSAELTALPLSTDEQQESREQPVLPESVPPIEGQEPSILAVGLSEAIAGFGPLPNVPAELDLIVRQDAVDSRGIYPGQKFLNHDFNLFTLRNNLSEHKVLHIATHAQFVPGPAYRSYLLLGTGERLAIPDIENWLSVRGSLRDIDLVVLSACETALGGPGLNGKEIAGIGYYFLKGGAKTVMASLWRVNDQSTQLLMEEFYNNLARGTLTSPVTAAEALRQAQLALMKGKSTPSAEQSTATRRYQYSHPYYWSAFILMGNAF